MVRGRREPEVPRRARVQGAPPEALTDRPVEVEVRPLQEPEVAVVGSAPVVGVLNRRGPAVPAVAQGAGAV